MAEIGDIGREILREWTGAARREGPQFWHYGELAKRLGRSGQGFIVAQALDDVGEWCAAQGLPDIAVMIVSKAKKQRGVMMPSDRALRKLGGAGEVLRMQQRVQGFDWARWDDSAIGQAIA